MAIGSASTSCVDLCEAILAHHGEVDLLAGEVVVARVGAVDQRVGGEAEVGRVDPHVGRLHQLRLDVHFGVRQVEARLRNRLRRRVGVDSSGITWPRTWPPSADELRHVRAR